jgi:hypothetical protein
MLVSACATTGVEPGNTGPGPEPEGHPALLILSQYQDTGGNVTLVVPYFVSLMGIDLLKKNPAANMALIKAYIQWYLDHLNYPDKYGLTGSMYDWRVYADGREESLNSMDSVDSYAALFIMLVDKYIEQGGDRSLIQANRQRFEDVIYLVPYLQQDDDLTIALPGTTGRYLMDNCEALAGVTAFVNLSNRMGWNLASYYSGIREKLLTAIQTHLYDNERENYYWLKDRDTKTASQWETFYPDALAQLFPILYGVLQSQTGRDRLWNLFHQYHAAILPDIPTEQRIIYQWTEEVMNNATTNATAQTTEDHDLPGHTAGGH